jgi:hypothetical protein
MRERGNLFMLSLHFQIKVTLLRKNLLLEDPRKVKEVWRRRRKMFKRSRVTGRQANP